MSKSLQNVAIGRFYKSNSLMHRMDERLKFFLIMILMASVGVSSSNYLLIFFGALAVLIGILSQAPVMIFLKGLRPFLFLFISTFLFHSFLTPGRYISFYFIDSIGMTYEGLCHGILIDFRLITLIYLSSVLTLTTAPEKMAKALEWLLKPFVIFGFPAKKFSMMILISFKFIPILFKEIDRTVYSREKKYNGGKWNILFSINKIGEMVFPVFINSFHRAQKLAVEIDKRGFEAIEKM